MGVCKPISSSSFDNVPLGMTIRQAEKLGIIKESPSGNPDPKNFEIINWKIIGNWTVALVIYPDCQNYEGRKIMVYDKPNLDEVIAANGGSLDPHFSDNKSFISPIARFEPTQRGFRLAEAFAVAGQVDE